MNTTPLVIFFDDARCSAFEPLTLTRTVDQLQIGTITIQQRWLRALGIASGFHIQSLNVHATKIPLDVNANIPLLNEHTNAVCINSRFLQIVPHNIMPTIELNTKLMVRDTIAICRLDCTQLQLLIEGTTLGMLSLQSIDIGAPRQIDENGIVAMPDTIATMNTPISNQFLELTNIQDLIAVNRHFILQDYQYLAKTIAYSKPNNDHPTPKQCYIHPTATIEPNATIITTDGAVIIEEHATIRSGAVIRGPVSIGAHAMIQSHSHIYGSTSIGAHCKVGGELSNTIMHPYSNKVHEGFIGNSIIGQWCNLGAGTTCSNLKLTYSPITVTTSATPTNRKPRQFFGIVMSDHAKTAIGCMIPCGTIIGVCTHLLTPHPHQRFYGSFRWVTTNSEEVHQLAKALQTAQTVMQRRNITMTTAYRTMLTCIFNSTIVADTTQ